MSLRSFFRRSLILRTAWSWIVRARQRAVFQQSFCTFRELAAQRSDLSVEWKDRYPCLDDATSTTGFDRHYVFHTAWAARVVADTRPALHVDVSSSLYFCGIVSAFVPVDFYDYRPAELDLRGLESRRGDLLALPFATGSVQSLSCMHVVEHIGLGRYGDPMDVQGDLKAIEELKRVLAPGGNLMFVVPVGAPKVMFNAHRIYGHDQVVGYFSELELKEFALVPDLEVEGGLIRDADPALVRDQQYGCGCFWFRKPLPLES